MKPSRNLHKAVAALVNQPELSQPNFENVRLTPYDVESIEQMKSTLSEAAQVFEETPYGQAA